MPGEEANALIGREQHSPFVKRSRFPVITSQNKVSFPLQPYRIVTYRSIFFCVEVISSTLVVRKQRNTLRFATIRLKWKTLGASFHLKASFHSGTLSVDWNGQKHFPLSCELWVGTNDFNRKKNVLARSNPRIMFLSGN